MKKVVKQTCKSPAEEKFAVIDLGSNTIRLAVFGVTRAGRGADKTIEKPSVRELLDAKVVAGLSAYVTGGEFSELGVDKATRILKTQIERAKNMGCKDVHIFATAVLRNAANSKAAVKEIEGAIDNKIDLLSAKQEAQLGLLGARFKTDMEAGAIVDLGGGSCEITRFCGSALETCSLKMGCVSAYSTCVGEIFPTLKEYSDIQRLAREMIEKEAPFLKDAGELFGIGGSVRAISKATREIKELGKTPRHIWKSDIDDIKNLAYRDPKKFAHLAVKAVPDRLHSLLPGAAIIDEVMRAAGATTLDICKGGIREGYLLSLVS